MGKLRIGRPLAVLVSVVALVLAAAACDVEGSVLKGRLTVAGTGAHPVGVPVTVYADDAETVVARTVTDVTGDYSFTGDALPDGTYRIRFSSTDWWDGAADWASATPVTVSAASPTTIDVTLTPATGSVSGTVTDGAGAVAGASVSAISTISNEKVASATSQSDGTYAFTDLPASTYVVRFEAPGRTTRYSDSKATRGEAPVIDVNPGEAVTGIDTVLAAESTLTGLVTDGTNPVGGVLVVAYDRTTGEVASAAITTVEGTFSVLGLDARTYAVGAYDRTETYAPKVVGSPAGVPTKGTPFSPPAADTLSVGTIELGVVESFYVRTDGSTGPDCGLIDDPCATISQAQTNALADDYRLIRVASGSYTDPVSLASGIEVDGGYLQDFSGRDDVAATVLHGTGTSAPVTISGADSVKLTSVEVEGAARTSGDAVGVVVDSSTNVTIGDVAQAITRIDGGSGPQATGLLVTGGSTVDVANVSVESGTPMGSGSSAYGIRALGGSTVDGVQVSVTAKPGVAGASAPTGTPARAADGCNASNGGNAGGPSSPGGGGSGGACTTNAGGTGGTGGNYMNAGSPGGAGGGTGGGGGGGGGCGSIFGCGTGAGGGAAGASGSAGTAGAAGDGSLTSAGSTWLPLGGGAGAAGSPGSGGGGGGGGKSASASGGGGGGGGGGGEGGAAGLVGGGTGGGSFGIYAVDATVHIATSYVVASGGGTGGGGAAGGQGGNGGNGGNGGSDSCCLAGGGGGGGAGGAGGGGGGAGGGAGGASVAGFHLGTGALTYPGTGMSLIGPGGHGGLGGAGGSGSNPGFRGNGNDTGGDGGSGDGSSNGATGADGPVGQSFTVWDNGPVS